MYDEPMSSFGAFPFSTQSIIARIMSCFASNLLDCFVPLKARWPGDPKLFADTPPEQWLHEARQRSSQLHLCYRNPLHARDCVKT